MADPSVLLNAAAPLIPVQVLSIAPGRVETGMHKQLRAAPDDQLPDRPEFIQLCCATPATWLRGE
jgi:hypothetical protein